MVIFFYIKLLYLLVPSAATASFSFDLSPSYSIWSFIYIMAVNMLNSELACTC